MILTKKIFAWALYDFADTAFSALFISFFYPILIKTYLGGNELQIGLSFGLSLLAAAFLVPFIGALSDATGKKIPILLVTTLVTVILTAATGYAGLYGTLALGLFANLFNIIDTDLYDSQLMDIAGPREQGRVSGLGAAVGYCGTIASLLMGYVVMQKIGWEKKEAVQVIFPATAVFYFIFSIPLFIFLKDPKRPPITFKASLQKALGEMKYTVTRMREMRGLGSFLIGSFIYNDGLNAVIVFLGLYATTVVGLTIQAFFFVFGALAVGSILGSLLAGWASDKIGPRKMLIVTLVTWILVVVYFLNMGALAQWLKLPNKTAAFLLGGMFGGAALGAVWVGNRHMTLRLAPAHKVAEIFGFVGLTKKFSGVMGSILFGLIVTKFGGYPNALLSILIFFILGLFFLCRIPKDVNV